MFRRLEAKARDELERPNTHPRSIFLCGNTADKKQPIIFYQQSRMGGDDVMLYAQLMTKLSVGTSKVYARR